MKPNADVGLELKIELPDSPDQLHDIGDEMAEGRETMRLQAKLNAEGIYIKIQGHIDAKYLLECIIAILGISNDGHHIQLNFAGAKGLDSLAISALIAALRNKGTKYNLITIEGLPVWAYVELNLIGADEILGHQWVSNNAPLMISFYRQT